MLRGLGHSRLQLLLELCFAARVLLDGFHAFAGLRLVLRGLGHSRLQLLLELRFAARVLLAGPRLFAGLALVHLELCRQVRNLLCSSAVLRRQLVVLHFQLTDYGLRGFRVLASLLLEFCRRAPRGLRLRFGGAAFAHDLVVLHF